MSQHGPSGSDPSSEREQSAGNPFDRDSGSAGWPHYPQQQNPASFGPDHGHLPPDPGAAQSGYPPPPAHYPQLPAYGADPYGPGSAPTSPYASAPYDLNPSQSPYGGYPPYAMAQPHPQGTLALVLGLVGVAALPPVGIGGLVIGSRVRREIDADPQRYSNRGIATAGYVLGIISTVTTALFVLVIILAIGLSVAGS